MVLLYIIFMLFFFLILSIKIVSPFRVLALFIIVTVLHISDRYNDSSRALLPAPTIETSSFLYRFPSQSEQKLIPLPSSVREFVLVSFLGLLPIARIILTMVSIIS